MERPPPHSIGAISAKRAGGKKVPKKYRKYHESEKKKKAQGRKSGGHKFTKGFVYVARGVQHIIQGLT